MEYAIFLQVRLDAYIQGVVTPILRAVTGIVTPYMANVGVTYHISLHSQKKKKKNHAIMVDFCYSHWVTSSIAVWSCSHGQFWAVTALGAVCIEYIFIPVGYREEFTKRGISRGDHSNQAIDIPFES